MDAHALRRDVSKITFIGTVANIYYVPSTVLSISPVIESPPSTLRLGLAYAFQEEETRLRKVMTMKRMGLGPGHQQSDSQAHTLSTKP